MPVTKIGDLLVDVTRKGIKNINLRVLSPDGKVAVSAPYYVSDRAISRFVQSKLEWIAKQQDKIRSRPDRPVLKYVTGERHSLFGEDLTLRLIEYNGSRKVIVTDKTIVIYTSRGSNTATREKIINKYYRSVLKERIPPFIARYEEIMKVRVNEYGIKKMKTRWGTCNRQSKRIWINLELAKRKPHLLEYIVVHEMTHLLEPSHNENFKTLMDKFYPPWRSLRKELNNNPL